VDLQLYLRILWRFRMLVLAGLLVALGLAFLSFVRVSLTGGPVFSYRQAKLWESRSTLLITQRGFPWGQVDPAGDVTESGIQPGEPSRFANLALVYSELATSDPVVQIMEADGPVRGGVSAVPVPNSADSRYVLPVMTISGIAASPEAALSTAERATAALLAYLQQQQAANDIPIHNRAILTPINRPQGAALVAGRSLTRPLVVFITAMMVVLALVFVLENLRPRVRPVAQPDVMHERPASRRTA
jgi:hypothetical protein